MLSACSRSKNSIKIKGSDTEVNLTVLMAESFHEVNTNNFISICGGGSGLGIASLLNGTTDIANSSRRINAEELSLFNKNKMMLDSFIFAQDAIAFVVSDQIPVDKISLKQLAAILSGELKNWSDICDHQAKINIYGRQSNSGTHEFVQDILQIDFSEHAKQMNGNAQITEAIKADPSGIGYVGAGYVMGGSSKGIKVLSIFENDPSKAISPFDAEAIKKGGYYFQRPLYQYYIRENIHKIQPFFDFEKSLNGAKIIHNSGYYPI